MKNFIQIFTIPALFIIVSCAGSKSEGVSLQDKFNSGMGNLEKEKFLQAQSDFKYVLLRGIGSDLGDDAQYYLGEAFFRNKEYLLAVAEYEKLTRRMAFSPFVEDARFKICEAYRIESPKYYHDQEYTKKSLERFQEFLDDFPNSHLNDKALASIESLREKLGLKLYETGILYMKLDEFESAKITFQTLIDMYYDTDMIQFAYQGMVKALARNKQIDEANAFLGKHKDRLVESELYADAQKTIDKMKKVVSKDTN